jgi:hypothetical protein
MALQDMAAEWINRYAEKNIKHRPNNFPCCKNHHTAIRNTRFKIVSENDLCIMQHILYSLDLFVSFCVKTKRKTE